MHIAQNLVSTNHAFATGITFLVTKFETVGYTTFMEAKSGYLTKLSHIVLEKV